MSISDRMDTHAQDRPLSQIAEAGNLTLRKLRPRILNKNGMTNPTTGEGNVAIDVYLRIGNNKIESTDSRFRADEGEHDGTN